MIEVEIYLEGKTNLYISDKVMDFIEECNERHSDGVFNLCHDDLEELVKRGFKENPEVVRPEKQKVFRIGVVKGKHRIYGFYTGNDGFVAIDVSKKQSGKNRKEQSRKIDAVAKVCKAGENVGWRVRK